MQIAKALRAFAFLLPTIGACAGPEPENLGEGQRPGEIDEPCDPDGDQPCVENARCSFEIDGGVEWFCRPHGDATRAGDPCEVQEDCGPRLQCTVPIGQRYCEMQSGELDRGRPCAGNGECLDGEVCSPPPEPELTCATRCVDDAGCPADQVCESYSVVSDGEVVPDVYSVCVVPG